LAYSRARFSKATNLGFSAPTEYLPVLGLAMNAIPRCFSSRSKSTSTEGSIQTIFGPNIGAALVGGRRPDRVATGGVSRAADELQRGHRPALWHGVAAQTGQPGADHAAPGEALGGRKSVARSIQGDVQSRSIAAFSPSSTWRRDSDGRLPSLLVSLVRSNVVT
jgi:hypothetical protein